jgi:hypothetical protein
MRRANSLRPHYLILVAILAFFMEGFIFYAKPKLAYNTSSPRSRSNNIAVYVENFKDARNEKGRGVIGETCNAFFKTGDVKEPDGIEEWAADAFKKELKSAGYAISDDPSCPLRLRGKVLSLYASLHMQYDSGATISITLISNGKVLLEKIYTGSNKTVKLVQLDISKGVSDSLNTSLKDAIKQSLADINSAVASQR